MLARGSQTDHVPKSGLKTLSLPTTRTDPDFRGLSPVNLKGCQILAGGRVIETTGKSGKNDVHPGGVPEAQPTSQRSG